jgi:hypothetical protein
MKRTLLALVAATVLATPAFAGQCPALAAQIEEALAAAADLPEETRATVTALLEEGMAQHEAGDHAASEATLFSAMEMLGIAPG